MLTDKKIRGVRRRLRGLNDWSLTFSLGYPEESLQAACYYNFKIPVHLGLVQGPQSMQKTRRQCAQALIDACNRLIRSKPESAAEHRIVATIGLPWMFSSEVCIYTDRDYFRSHTLPSAGKYGETTVISDRSLAAEWNLVIPPGLSERGLLDNFQDPDVEGGRSITQRWYIGELDWPG